MLKWCLLIVNLVEIVLPIPKNATEFHLENFENIFIVFFFPMKLSFEKKTAPGRKIPGKSLQLNLNNTFLFTCEASKEMFQYGGFHSSSCNQKIDHRIHWNKEVL